MGNTVKIDQLATEIMKGLTEYADMATDDMKAAVKKAGTSVKKDIQSIAPRIRENMQRAGLQKPQKRQQILLRSRCILQVNIN